MAIGLILLAYTVSTLVGWTRPQHAASVAAHAEAPATPDWWAVTPFAFLLAAIAVLPIWRRAEHWWENNLHKLYVAGGLALVTMLYLALLHPGASVDLVTHTVEHVVARDYVPFIVVLFSLFTISGGIRIEGDLPAHALTNTSLIAAGGLLASFVGTTGAAMLLIRPLLETNSERRHVAHTVVFFIFVVCNCGGLLLPIGDPPLFLGYLQGVDFFWTLSLWKHWLLVNGLLLVVYFVLDHFYHYPRETKDDLAADESRLRPLSFQGLWPNVPLLVGVVLSVALLDPGKPLPLTTWHPWPFLREATQLALVAISLMTGNPRLRAANQFDYAPIVEVAVLFIGIFVTMQPALEILSTRGADLGLDTPHKLFWATGWLSAVLDNAPTYLVFFQAARAVPAEGMPRVAGIGEPLLVAIALGAVNMGAMSYIGNGPNFMVKTIAERAGVAMPSFFRYALYSGLYLLPILALDAWLLLD
jgi:Na+/H+ antiporter NhaD/arsenite permease-like protein